MRAPAHAEELQFFFLIANKIAERVFAGWKMSLITTPSGRSAIERPEV